MCIYMYIYVYICVYIYINMYMYIHIYINTYLVLPPSTRPERAGHLLVTEGNPLDLTKH